MRFRFLFVSIMLVWSVAASAQDAGDEPIATDRPDFTETAETVPFQRIQLEGGYSFSRLEDEKAHSLGELLLRIATGRRTEARIGLNSYSWVRGPEGRFSGLEDATLGFKVKLLDGDEALGFRRPNIALIGEASIPSGSSAFREDNLQPGAKICLAWDLTDKLGMGSNLNYAWASEAGRRFGQFSGTLAFGYSVCDRAGVFLEYFTFIPGSRGGPNLSTIDGGVTYLVNNDYQLDVRVGLGLNSARPDYFIGAGFGRRW